MVSRQTLLVGSVVILATLAVVVPAVSAGALGAADRSASVDASEATIAGSLALTSNETAANDSENETAFGTQMAAFMQSNAAQVDDSVDNGMWEAGFERANESERARLAHTRTENLSARMAALQAQNETLQERYENGSLSYQEYVVQAAQLNGRMEALEHGVNGTARAAERAGLNTSALSDLRRNAHNMTGPEVAGIAKSLVRGDRGPPADVPGKGANVTDRDGGPPSDAPGNQNAGDGANVTRDDGNVTARSGGSGNQSSGQGGGDGGNEPGSGDAGDGGNSDDNPGNGPASLLDGVILFTR